MKKNTSIDDPLATATLGFAANSAGDGVAYVALCEADDRDETVVRVTFRCRPLPALRGRDIAYAATEAVAAHVLRRGLRAVALVFDDVSLLRDLADHAPVPAPLTIPYVRLRCTLNRFDSVDLRAIGDQSSRDLGARARAEVALAVAA
jgi:hypothetical protein